MVKNKINKIDKIENNTRINQLYIEILCNIIRKQNLQLLEKIGEVEKLPILELNRKYIITKNQVKNKILKYTILIIRIINSSIHIKVLIRIAI